MRHTKNSTSVASTIRKAQIAAGMPLLLLPALAVAQNAPLAPADNAAPATKGSLPASVGGLMGPARIDTIELKDYAVTEALEMIAKFGEVSIIIAPDVDKRLTLPYISLNNITAEEAIQKVSRASFLQWQKTGLKEYMIAKTMPDSAPAQPVASSKGGNGFNQGLFQGVLDPPVQTGNGTSSKSEPFQVTPIPDLRGPGVGSSDLSADISKARATTEFNLPPLHKESESSREGKRIAQSVKVSNVRAGIMAWWVDRANQPVPYEVRKAQLTMERRMQPYPAIPISDPAMRTRNVASSSGRESYNPYSAESPDGTGGYGQIRGNAQFGGNQNRNQNRNTAGSRTGGAGFQLPEGVESIVAIDSQNVLLVYGTEEGVREMESIISILDRPVQQVEIIAQFVSVTNTDARSFGIDYSMSNGPFTGQSNGLSSGTGTFSLGFVKGNFQAKLNALVTQRRAKAIQSPRVTTLNNLTADVSFTSSTPFILTSAESNLGGGTSEGQEGFVLETGIFLTVTPTINADGTITMMMEPEVQIQDAPTASGIPGFSTQNIRTVANIEDGDTIALGGLRTRNVTRENRGIPILRSLPFGLGKLFQGVDNSSADNDLIIFVTARVVRRAIDNAQVPGT